MGLVYFSALFVYNWREYGVVLLFNPNLSLLFLVVVKELLPLEGKIIEFLIDGQDLSFIQGKCVSVNYTVQNLNLVHYESIRSLPLHLDGIQKVLQKRLI